MKKFILLVIAIVMIFAISGIVYASYLGTIQATKVQYPIIIDSLKVDKDIPMISIEDRIYMPIRAMCDVLNIKIEWNEEGKVEIMTPKQQNITNDYNISQDMALKIADIVFVGKFGQDFVEKTKISVEEIDGAYKVYRCFEEPILGGDGTITISKMDGRIISIIAGE